MNLQPYYNAGAKPFRMIFGAVAHVTNMGFEERHKRRMSSLIGQQKKISDFFDKNKKSKNPKIQKKIARNLKASAANLNEVRSKRKLITVPAEGEYTELHKQLLRDEKVHLIVKPSEEIADKHLRELRTHRLGFHDKETAIGTNKDCQAFIVDTKKGPYALAQIFRYHAQIPEVNGMIDVRQLPGNIEDIVNAPARQLTGEENVTGYWTISSGWRNTGPTLVTELESAVPAGNLEHTISPIREFYEGRSRGQILAMSDDQIRLKVLDYLMNENDSVKNFHLGNGASVGWIHINRDYETDWIIVNYVYERNTLERNQEIFKSKEYPMLPVSGALYGVLPPHVLHKAYNVTQQPILATPRSDFAI